MQQRWKGHRLLSDVDDTCQEVFLELLKDGGPLQRADRKYSGGFRAFLLGVIRNVARRTEQRYLGKPLVKVEDLGEVNADETSLSRAFDRAWAVGMVREAATRQEEAAKQDGNDAVRRVQMLRLRFHEGLPVREIASRWQVDSAMLHRELSKAKREFLHVLREVVGAHNPGALPGEVDRDCQELLNLLNGS